MCGCETGRMSRLGGDFTVFYKHKSSGEGDVYRSFEKPNNFDNKMDLLLSKLGLKVNYKF